MGQRQMKKRIENIMKQCDRRMLRYMTGVSWADRIPSVDVAKICGLTDIQGKMRQRRLQWFGQVRKEKDGEVQGGGVPERPNEHGERQWSQTWKN